MAKRTSVLCSLRVYFLLFHNSQFSNPMLFVLFWFSPFVFFSLFAGGPICRANNPHTTPNNKERHREGERDPFPTLFKQFMLKSSWYHPFEIPLREENNGNPPHTPFINFARQRATRPNNIQHHKRNK
ncbi:uncharacterized protein TM35_000212960 [Trypanosoma theileri]|uniref:Uncharacterized protein n=1 Tax=Trypanosoma theileri TaxID=67003 RepID=A0A1X0NUB0_9TRYP|nr:uncharacterized protein TM35_000212960 [Trypanosoma theileri]ORC87690.1 hypothetical protein TM35_000212960 [Trypanosoma theileri]